MFWKQEYKFLQPTPIPENLKTIHKGDTLDIPFLRTFQKNTYIHFYNYDCPCSRFNIKEFQAMVRKYDDQIKFIAVLQTEDNDAKAIKKFKKKYDLGIETLLDPKGEIAHTLGVYSTPQAVILKGNTLFYKGNYNKARFCLSKNTRFAELALAALLNNEPSPSFPAIAEIAYGCELPINSTPKKRFYNLF
ncbi:redoxin domain-containing protein [Fulvivirga sp. M361]|uniref:TlpA family protein disulfide reductase n=1 Tax=Fulvivirga sp. M361 TaxID=2594266 RepID=UPI001623D1D8|nr:redoxin domain-containing protein [Fulvivirga sp. M361]